MQAQILIALNSIEAEGRREIYKLVDRMDPRAMVSAMEFSEAPPET